jgi:hypothetical protein
MEAFEITDRLGGNQPQRIIAKALKLIIEVHEDRECVKDYDVAYETTHIGGLDNEYNLYFVVRDGNTKFGYNHWSIELFMEAIEYYCAVDVKNEPLSIEAVNEQASSQYDGKLEGEMHLLKGKDSAKRTSIYNLLNGY